MTRQQSSASTDREKVDRRRSKRIVLSIPVRLTWTTKEGEQVQEHAETEVVSAHGALLRMKTHPPTSIDIELTHKRTNESTRARLVKRLTPREDGIPRATVDLAVPSETFWGFDYQLQKASLELRQLELAIPPEDFDPRVLSELHQAVDYVGQAAWVIHQWMDLQAKNRDPYATLSLLARDRIGRATKLSNDLCADLDALEVTFETGGLEQLFEAVKRLHTRLVRLFKK